MAGGPNRRAVLAASAAAVPFLVSGCRGVQVLGTPPPPAPDVRLLRSAILTEQLMISRYHAVLAGPAASSGVTAKLSALLTEHEQHLVELKSRLIVPAGSAASARPAPGRATVPASLTDALAALSAAAHAPSRPPATPALLARPAAEHAASRRLATQLLTVPPALAQLLGSISASEATHVPVLDQLRRTS